MRKKTKLVRGIGINDSDYETKDCPFYLTWKSMLRRCYSAKYQETRPNYKGCSVCKEWLYFMTFRKWMLTQFWEGNQIDKDIIHPFNKVYSPENCCFVSLQLNSLLNIYSNGRGLLPLGVCWDKRDKKYVAQIRINNKRKHLGYFDSVSEASSVYNHAKAAYIIEIASKVDCIRIQAGLCMWAYLYRQGEVV